MKYHLIVLSLICIMVDGIHISHLKQHSLMTTSDQTTDGYIITLSDSSKYCQSTYGSSSTAISPTCCNSQQKMVSMNQICQSQYQDKTTIAYQMDSTDAKSWICEKPNTNYNHYTIDLNKYCQSKGYSKVMLSTTIPQNVFSWYCTGNKPNLSLGADLMNSICQSQSINSNALTLARYGNYNDPKTWFCFEPYVVVGGMDITHYCQSSNIMPPCVTQAIIQNGQWFCESSPSVDFNQICKSKGMIFDASQARSGILKCK